jgi:hypothetical protein
MFSGTEIIKIFAMIYEHVVQQTVGIAVDTNFWGFFERQFL